MSESGPEEVSDGPAEDVWSAEPSNAPAKLELSAPKRQRVPSWLINTAELVAVIVIAIVVALVVQAHVVKPYRIPSGSMIPTLIPGQRILVDRLDTKPKLGDIVVFHPPIGADNDEDPQCGDPAAGDDRAKPCDKPLPDEATVTFVKRVVGLPGDRLSIRNGIVYRNGKPEKLPYTAKQAGTNSGYVSCSGGGPVCSFPETITVPAGDYYMMGDNRGNSLDSRYWGPVPQRWIIGVAFFTYWPPDRVGTL